VRAEFVEPYGDSPADAASSAGNDRDLACQRRGRFSLAQSVFLPENIIMIILLA
jgi:hypothetical protein